MRIADDAAVWPGGPPRAAPDILLAVRGATVRFGGVTALDGVSFDVPRGTVCGLIGPNGAGKTTLFNCLSRLYRLTAGEIVFDGARLDRLPAQAVAALGVGRTFQNLALFGTLSVAENVMVGGHCRTASGFLRTALHCPGVRHEEAAAARRARELLGFLGLEAVAGVPVARLPFGVQKKVEFARALAAEPKLLLLDEPACGLNHEEMDGLRQLIRATCDRLRITVLLVEHNMQLVMAVSDRVVAMSFGRVIADGTPAVVQSHPDVVTAYLGKAA